MEKNECSLHRQHILEKIERNEKRINNYGERLDLLEQHKSGIEQQIKNLVDKMEGLITTIRWFTGLLIGAFISFFFYAVQSGILK